MSAYAKMENIYIYCNPFLVKFQLFTIIELSKRMRKDIPSL